jgi:hypothetical protein
MSVLYWQRTVAKQANRGAMPRFVQLVDETIAAFLPKRWLFEGAMVGSHVGKDAAGLVKTSSTSTEKTSQIEKKSPDSFNGFSNLAHHTGHASQRFRRTSRVNEDTWEILPKDSLAGSRSSMAKSYLCRAHSHQILPLDSLGSLLLCCP